MNDGWRVARKGNSYCSAMNIEEIEYEVVKNKRIVLRSNKLFVILIYIYSTYILHEFSNNLLQL